MAAHRFAIARQENGLEAALEAVASRIGLGERLGGASVFLKPNLTYPFEKPGVTTTRPFIVAVVRLLKDAGCRRIVLGDGDGGYNSFSMDQTFVNYDFEALKRHYGVDYVNVGRWPSRTLSVEARRGRFDVKVPEPLSTDFDSLLSLPVPKVHCMTTISNAVKNQWGLIQDPLRLSFHCAFNEIITEVNTMLPQPFALVDGTFGLTQNGPMVDGVTLPLGWVSACDNLWMNDVVMCRIMRIPQEKVAHLRHAAKQGLVPPMADWELPEDLHEYEDDRFYLRRNVWNRVAKLTWYSPRLSHLAYTSALSGFLHRVMYSVRRKPEELQVRGIDWS